MDLAAFISSLLSTGSTTGSSVTDFPILELLGSLSA